jgi:hypothetical protein
MANPKKKQRALKHQRAVARNTTARKRRGGGGGPASPGRLAVLQAAGSFPLHEVLITQDWENTAQITQILVARRAPAGQMIAGVFLVDLACLGVKSAFIRLFPSPAEYERIRSGIRSRQKMIACDLNLAAKVVREAVRYARSLGFEPNPDYQEARLIFGDADPDASPVAVPTGGPEGKPLFMAGPHDDAQQIIQHLTRKLGPNGFHFMAPLVGDEEFDFGEEEDVEREEVEDKEDDR